MTIRTGIRDLCGRAHSIAVEHGWWDRENAGGSLNIGEKLALIHSEVSEALEIWRNGDSLLAITLDEKGKPEGFPAELADIIIRVADLAGQLHIDLGAVIEQKMDYNETRPYRHGGKIA